MHIKKDKPKERDYFLFFPEGIAVALRAVGLLRAYVGPTFGTKEPYSHKVRE